jgi:hypothetical protein
MVFGPGNPRDQNYRKTAFNTGIPHATGKISLVFYEIYRVDALIGRFTPTQFYTRQMFQWRETAEREKFHLTMFLVWVNPIEDNLNRSQLDFAAGILDVLRCRRLGPSNLQKGLGVTKKHFPVSKLMVVHHGL